MINQAIIFATKAHEGQVRKVNGSPFIMHPLAVGCLLADAGENEEIILAGILHDTVEDTHVTIDEIRELFGENVAELVDGCSEDKALSWTERKENTINFLALAPKEVCIITCADKIHNLTVSVDGIRKKGKDFFLPFNKGYEEQKWYYKSIRDVLHQRIPDHPLFQNYANVYKEAFEKLG